MCDGPQHSHRYFKSFVGTLAIARMDARIVVKPASHIFDIWGHVQVIIHAPFAGKGTCLIARHCSPSTSGEHFRETIRAMNSDLGLAPTVIHFGNIRGARPTFEYSPHSIGKLNEAANVVRRSVIVGQLSTAGTLRHDPFR